MTMKIYGVELHNGAYKMTMKIYGAELMGAQKYACKIMNMLYGCRLYPR